MCILFWGVGGGASKQQAKAIYCRESSSPILGAPAALNAAPIECIPLGLYSGALFILSHAALFVNMQFSQIWKIFAAGTGSWELMYGCDGGRHSINKSLRLYPYITLYPILIIWTTIEGYTQQSHGPQISLDSHIHSPLFILCIYYTTGELQCQ